MTLQEFRDILLGFGQLHGLPAFHNHAEKATGDYIFWYEFDTAGYRADNRRMIKSVKLQAEIVTAAEYSSLPDELESLFEAHGITYDGPVIFFSTEGEKTRYIYDCEVVLDGNRNV